MLKKRCHFTAIWVSKCNPGGLDLANVCPKYSCPKLWRIKETLFAMVVNSLGEPRLGSPMNEGHSFHSSLGATLNQNQSPSETKHRSLCWHPVVSSAPTKCSLFYGLGFPTKKKKKKRTQNASQERDYKEWSFILCKAFPKDQWGNGREEGLKCEIHCCVY